MKNIKKYLAAITFVICNAFGTSAHAGIPVIDAAALVQQIQQVLSWGQQYQQMYEQYQKLQEQYQKAVETLQNFQGPRGMGNLAGDLNLRQALPTNFASSFETLRSMGINGATAEARSIYDSIKSYGCNEQLSNAAEIRNCEAIALATPQAIAMLNSSLGKAQSRAGVIQGLIGQIESAADAKAAADLGNRIQSEMTLLANEKMMMDLANSTQLQQLALAQQQKYEMSVKRMKYGTGTNPFAKSVP